VLLPKVAKASKAGIFAADIANKLHQWKQSLDALFKPLFT
jgi:hypothetical protein